MPSIKTYIIRRLLLAIPTLIGLIIFIFAVTTLFSPYERAALYIADPKQIGNISIIIEKYHLNDPVHIQFIHWVGAVLQGNMGWSKSVNMKVSDAIINFLPTTVELAIFTTPIIVLLGIFLGKSSAVHRDKLTDYVTRTLAIIGWSLPSFWLGIVLLSIFYGIFKSFPPGMLSVGADSFINSPNFVRYTRMNTIDAILNGQLWIFLDALQHMVLPVITLTVIDVALIIRVMRSEMLEQLQKGYVVAARAKGLSEKEVIDRHVTKNALIPIVTLSGLLLASMLCGVMITETVFLRPGIGRWAVHAAIQLDIPAVLGFALFAGVAFVFTNTIVDILYAYIDPRIRLR